MHDIESAEQKPNQKILSITNVMARPFTLNREATIFALQVFRADIGCRLVLKLSTKTNQKILSLTNVMAPPFTLNHEATSFALQVLRTDICCRLIPKLKILELKTQIANGQLGGTPVGIINFFKKNQQLQP